MKCLKLILKLNLLITLSACSAIETLTNNTSSSNVDGSSFEVPIRERGTARINVKDQGARGDGTTDDTDAFQNSIYLLPADGGTVYVPAGNYIIDPIKNIFLRNKMHLEMDPNAKLIAKPNAEERTYILNALVVSDLEISGGQLVGDRDTHLGTTGEWGHGIMVRGSTRVTIRDMKISKFWGDGISIGATNGTTSNPSKFSDDVVIYNVVSTQNRRQGLTIGRSKNIKVYNSEFSYTQGTAPEYGIDIEPDPIGTEYYARNVHIENCKINNNKGGGVSIYKEVYELILKKNQILDNTYGIYAVEGFGGSIVENYIARSGYQGIALRNGTSDYTVSGNTFRNNHTVLHGITTEDQPLIPMTGLVSGNNGNGAHIQVVPETTNIRVLTNLYAK